MSHLFFFILLWVLNSHILADRVVFANGLSSDLEFKFLFMSGVRGAGVSRPSSSPSTAMSRTLTFVGCGSAIQQ